MKVEIAKSHAKRLEIEVNEEGTDNRDFFISMASVGKWDYVLFIEARSYFTRILGKVGKSPVPISQFLGGEGLEFYPLVDRSESAKVRAIQAKAKDLLSKNSSGLDGVEGILNNIPWKFLGMQTASILKRSAP